MNGWQSSNLPTRFWERVHRNPLTGCWEWTGATSDTGYGNFTLPKLNSKRRTVLVHRFAFEQLQSLQVSKGLDMDHLCRVRCCLNPSHLEPVTRRENVRRGDGARRSACKNGHPYTPRNTYIRPDDGTQQCKTCHEIRRGGSRRFV